MRELVVTDSTCLIGLERIGQLDILPTLFETILIPLEVFREVGVAFLWLIVKDPTDQALVSALKILVDDGEAEAIALACKQKCRIILDDRQARSVARRLGISITGTVGILVQAKRLEMIPSLKTLLSELETKGFYISNILKEEALRLTDEL